MWNCTKNLLLIGLTFTKHSPIMCACKEQDGSLVKVYELNMQFSMQNQSWENCKSGEIYYAEKERELSSPAFRYDFCPCKP